ncbi:hypothetical protein ABZ851_30610 [Streptomyces sp. NPDC047049]|uniref:hypothetical protein n=1 Tax=Streptomyces sp. NPDC047049 TaxID=3156688 RepID=UPI003411DDB8
MGAEICYTGRIDFDKPVPAAAIGVELAELRDLEQDELFSLAYSPVGDLAGVIADDRHMFGHTHQWRRTLHLLETIAHSQQQRLTADATWVSDPGPYFGTLIIDTLGRFHEVLDDECADTHRSSGCNCYVRR